MILVPDWLIIIEAVSRSILYVGIGFSLFTHFLIKWLEYINS